MARILVVDDWPMNREFLVTLLRYGGHEVTTAADGAAALAAMKSDSPDLVISDILMPVMDGGELARRAAADPELAGIPFIFYTAVYRLAEARSLAAACGVTTVIAKPSDPQDLLDAVHGELGLPLVELRPGVVESTEDVAAATSTQGLQLAFLDEFGGLRTHLRTSVSELAPPLNGEAQHLQQIVSRVDEAFLRAQGLSMRLATVVELGIELSQRDAPEDLLDVFCRGVRDVLNAKLAVACVVDESGNLVALATSGLPPAPEVSLHRRVQPTSGLFGDLLRDGEVRAMEGIRSPADIGLPPDHPPISSLLATRIASHHQSFGWFYVADRVGEERFGNEDRQLVGILAAQFATQYENRILLDRTKRHAGLLAVEVDERRVAADRLRDSERRFRQLAENIREVFFLFDTATGEVLYASPAYEEIWSRSIENLRTNPEAWLDAVHMDDREVTRAEFAAARESGLLAHEFRIVNPDAAERWVRLRGFPIFDDTGRLWRMAGIAEDITEAKLQALQIQRLSRILDVLSSINATIVRIRDRGALFYEACRIAHEQGGFPLVWIGVFQTDGSVEVAASRGLDARTIRAAEAFSRTRAAREWAPARAARRSRQVVVYRDLDDTNAAEGTAGPIARLALKKGCRSLATLPLVVGDEVVACMSLYASDYGLFNEEEVALLGELAGDVSFALQYIAKEEQVNYLAYYDSLTGLANSSLFHERLRQMIDARPSKAALFVADIHRFRGLNDSFGRHVGDRLLAEVAQRLARSVPEPHLLGRVGPDVFAVGVPSLRSVGEAGSVLEERVLSALKEPFEFDNRELRLTFRVGAAVYPGDGTDAETLFKNAEAALNGAKGSNARFMFYSPELNARVAEDLALEQALRGALERREFRVYYQPKITAMSGELVGLEALIRWQRPDGIVSPERFMTVLEDSELIIDAGRWVIEQVLEDYRGWQQRGLRPPRISVNVSAAQLRYADFAEMVLSALDRAGIDGSALELEITESLIMADIDASTQRLEQLNVAGVAIAIDDFGTGYSSLRYLAKLPVDTLKIDRSFIVRMALESDSKTLVSTMIDLGHAFGLSVVAEGVDSEEQADLLRVMKCDVLQGYLFSKPMPAETIEKFLLHA